MARQIRSAFIDSRATLLKDALGAASLMMILFVGLSLPGLL